MILFACLYAILCLPMLKAQSPTKLISVRLLDSLLQEYAFRALFDRPPITGVVYDANVPSNLTGIEVSALRLRGGSLRERGFHSYNEFHIPIGVVEQPFVERLALVYHNLGNWSSLYYPLPGYTFLSPVLGLLAYDASTLSATNEAEILEIRASGKPIIVSFPNVQLAPDKGSPKCVHFDLYGSVEFDNVLRGNACSAIKQGHFSMVVELITASSPAPATGVPPRSNGISSSRKGNHKEFIAVGIVVVGVLVVMLLPIWVRKCRRRERIQRMEEEAQWGVPLSMATVESMKVPVANATRTRPSLEHDEYVPFSDFS